MKVELTPDERLKCADDALDELLDKYQVDICVDEDGAYFFDVKEPEPPKLKIV